MRVAVDLDGTLITCEPRHSAVLQAALEARCLRADLTRVWEIKRAGSSTEAALFAAGLSHVDARVVAGEWKRMIEEPVWLALDRVLPGVPETLEEMRRTSRLMLLTARGRREWLPQQLCRLNLGRFFDSISVVSPKHPVEEKARVLKEESVDAFFGDTESDLRAAALAGVTFCPVSSGQRDRNFLGQLAGGVVFEQLPDAWNNVRKGGSSRPEIGANTCPNANS